MQGGWGIERQKYEGSTAFCSDSAKLWIYPHITIDKYIKPLYNKLKCSSFFDKYTTTYPDWRNK